MGRRFLAIFFALGIGVAAHGSFAAGEPHLEDAVKAAYLFKFSHYVEWPAENSAEPLVIGVAGADPIADELDRVAAENRSKGHPVAIRRMRPEDSTAGLQILFIGRLDQDGVNQWLGRVRGQPILTVTD